MIIIFQNLWLFGTPFSFLQTLTKLSTKFCSVLNTFGLHKRIALSSNCSKFISILNRQDQINHVFHTPFTVVYFSLKCICIRFYWFDVMIWCNSSWYCKCKQIKISIKISKKFHELLLYIKYIILQYRWSVCWPVNSYKLLIRSNPVENWKKKPAVDTDWQYTSKWNARVLFFN